jgi:hypothetical protein
MHNIAMLDDFEDSEAAYSLKEPTTTPLLYRQRVVSTEKTTKSPSIYPSKNHRKPAPKRNKLPQKQLQPKIFCDTVRKPSKWGFHLFALL